MNTTQQQSKKSGKYVQLIKQLLKFGITGIINTGIDFVILNILTFLTGITQGYQLFGLNVASFSIATVNSYFLNKYWTFEARSKEKQAAQFSQFLAISIIGAIINSGIVAFFTTYISPAFGLSPAIWVNVAKVFATFISLIWNFIGYKFIVFRRKTTKK